MIRLWIIVIMPPIKPIEAHKIGKVMNSRMSGLSIILDRAKMVVALMMIANVVL